MHIYECLMIMLMLCKSSYARLTPRVLHLSSSVDSTLHQGTNFLNPHKKLHGFCEQRKTYNYDSRRVVLKRCTLPEPPYLAAELASIPVILGPTSSATTPGVSQAGSGIWLTALAVATRVARAVLGTRAVASHARRILRLCPSMSHHWECLRG